MKRKASSRRSAFTLLEILLVVAILALLAAPTDGTYDLTELFVARYGKPKVNQAVWMRVFQHTDGWIDVPKVLRARVLPPIA